MGTNTEEVKEAAEDEDQENQMNMPNIANQVPLPSRALTLTCTKTGLTRLMNIRAIRQAKNHFCFF